MSDVFVDEPSRFEKFLGRAECRRIREEASRAIHGPAPTCPHCGQMVNSFTTVTTGESGQAIIPASPKGNARAGE